MADPRFPLVGIVPVTGTSGRGALDPGKTDPMNTASGVFINGIAGVFTGIAVLYLMMKMLSFVAGRPTPGSAPHTLKTD